ncbi:thiamine phosphate synthase [Enterococcus sp. HY326]|uniref:thiamine phosphate synthase n=1 Tax=Enterococcus sp. HY326 TaxID=2971265 RepID=UPI00223EE3EB|nr:thiamine phosphate synthase [Enterococcus sp. HY326]
MEKLLKLYLVTGAFDLSEEQFLSVITEACENGVTLVQLREKTLTTGDFFNLAVKVKKITDTYQIPLIINDRVDICLAVDAAGVHIGDDELSVSVTRQLIGNKILGVSAKSVARAKEAQASGADYLGVGAMFPTKTKDSPVTPLNTLKDITATVTIPVVAIGGINETNLQTFSGSGIAGIAVVSEIMKAEKVAEKVRSLTQKMNELLEEK